MAQRVNLSPTGLPVRKKTFIAKTVAAIVSYITFVYGATNQSKLTSVVSAQSKLTNINILE